MPIQSKHAYIITIMLFVVGLAFVLMNVLSVGCILCGIAFYVAYATGKANRHL